MTAIVITFELTTNFTLLVPLMFTCIISSVTAEIISKGGLYDRLMRWNGIHVRGPASSDSLRNIQAKDVMQNQYEVFNSNFLIKDTLPALSTTAQRGFPVVDRGILVGVLTQTDLAKINQVDSLSQLTIADVMTPHPVAVSPYDSLEDILFLFSHHKFTWLPVAYNGKLQGIILQSNLLSALFNQERS